MTFRGKLAMVFLLSIASLPFYFAAAEDVPILVVYDGVTEEYAKAVTDKAAHKLKQININLQPEIMEAEIEREFWAPTATLGNIRKFANFVSHEHKYVHVIFGLEAFADNPFYFGLAQEIGCIAKTCASFSMKTWASGKDGAIMAHEIAHNFGCTHDTRDGGLMSKDAFGIMGYHIFRKRCVEESRKFRESRNKSTK